MLEKVMTVISLAAIAIKDICNVYISAYSAGAIYKSLNFVGQDYYFRSFDVSGFTGNGIWYL